MKKNFSIGEAYSEAIALLKSNFLFLVGATILITVISWVFPAILQTFINTVFSIHDPYTGKAEISIVGVLLELLVRVGFLLYWFVLSLGIQRIYLNLSDGKKVTIHDLFDSQGVYLSNVFMTFVLVVVIGLGFLFFIIPGVIFSIIFSFASLFLIEEKKGFMGALSRSTDLTKGVRLKLWVFFIISSLIEVVGTFFFGIGYFIAMPLVGLAKTHVYKVLKSQLEARTNASSSASVNSPLA